jgi:hypothetical protein
MVRGTWIVGLVAIGLGGCAPTTVYYLPLVTPPRPMVERPREQVDVYVTTPPSRPHLDVGLLQVIEYRQFSDATSQQMMLHLKGAAAAQGCDAVLITAVDMRSNRYAARSIHGSCEVYTDVPADHPVALPAPPPQPAGIVVTIGNAGVDVRAAPSKAAQVVTRMNAGLRVIVHPAFDGWSFVKLSDGRIGYVDDVAFFPDR